MRVEVGSFWKSCNKERSDYDRYCVIKEEACDKGYVKLLFADGNRVLIKEGRFIMNFVPIIRR